MSPASAHRHPFARLVRRLLAAVLLAGALALPAHPVARAATTIVFVNPAVGPGGGGTSWADAYDDLQTALAPASTDQEIWVAAGAYKPTTGADRSFSFNLKNGVAIYGGFAGTEGQREERNVAASLTTLSGDIGNPGDASDNSYHVVTGGGTNATAILDGFTISGGNATDADPNDRGGGMYNNSSSPTLGNLTFTSNRALYGGGIFNVSSSPLLSNVTFASNIATIQGGGMYNQNGSNPPLTTVTFTSNTASQSGGGMSNDTSSPPLTNVTFASNIATIQGGGMYNQNGSNPPLTNVTFAGNSATNLGGGMSNDTSNPPLSNVTFASNSATNLGGGMLNLNSNPPLTTVTFAGNSATNGGGMLNLNSNPPLTTVTFASNSATNLGGGMLNESSNPTLTNVTFTNNSATNFGGGMDNLNSNPALSNVTFTNNSATNFGGGMVNTNSNPPLTNVTFTSNSATNGNGGGMFNENSSPPLTNVTFTSNSATNGNGGGMFNNSSSPLLTNVRFNTNTAVNGGGIHNFAGSNPPLRGGEFKSNAVTGNGGGMFNDASIPTLTRVTFDRNSAATGSGGGMFNQSSSPPLANIQFRGNSAINGGGVYNFTTSNPTLTNASFSGNSATNRGGGMVNDNSTPVLNDVTFSSNSATTASGGGMFNVNSSSPPVRNSIFWGNSNGAIVNSDPGSTPTVSFSLIEGGCPSQASCTAILSADPQFVDANGADDTFGTPDDNPRPQGTSPAIDFGDNSLRPTDIADLDGDGNTTELLPLDLDDQPRLFDYPAVGAGANRTIDLGAYELEVAHVVNVGSPLADGSYKAGQLIPIVITFNEAVTVGSTPQLTLETGASDAVVSYSGGSGTTTLTFTYTVAAGHTSADLDYASTSALALNGGMIRDAGNTNADLTLHTPGAPGSLSANNALVIDTIAPSVTINQAAGQSDSASATPVSFAVVFSESVSGFATGDVILSGTAGATTATVSGSGASYTVAVSGMTTSGTVIVSIAAEVATDAAGNGNSASTSSDNQVSFNKGLTISLPLVRR